MGYSFRTLVVPTSSRTLVRQRASDLASNMFVVAVPTYFLRTYLTVEITASGPYHTDPATTVRCAEWNVWKHA
jgi:hypothetical protein